LRRSGTGVELSEELSSGGQVGRPAEPSSVTSIEVHVDTEGVEGLDGVGDTRLVGSLSTTALGNVKVGDQVGQRVGLDDSNDTNIGVFLDLSSELVDVVVVLVETVVGDRELSVGSKAAQSRSGRS